MGFSRRATRSNFAFWKVHSGVENCVQIKGRQECVGRKMQGYCSGQWYIPQTYLFPWHYFSQRPSLLLLHSKCISNVSYYPQLEIKGLKLIHQKEWVHWSERISLKQRDVNQKVSFLDRRRKLQEWKVNITARRRGCQTSLWHCSGTQYLPKVYLHCALTKTLGKGTL